METRRGYTFLLIGIAIPLCMYLALLGSAQIATAAFKPQYNILYVLNLEIGGEVRKLFFDEFDKGLDNITQQKIDYFERAGVEFYVYDVKKNTEHKVSLRDVKKWNLSDLRRPAPDGYEFTPNVLENQFTTEVSHFFDSDNWIPKTSYMRKGELNIKMDHVPAYSREVVGDYLGWVIK
jgi:hypothetical protein